MFIEAITVELIVFGLQGVKKKITIMRELTPQNINLESNQAAVYLSLQSVF